MIHSKSGAGAKWQAVRSIIIVYIEISREVYQKVHILTGSKPVSKDSDLVE